LNRGFSIYLDLVRVLAALEVFFFHLSRAGKFGLVPAGWNAWGHEAVVVFFVLSGYVVTYAARERDRTLERFCVNRFTRIFSVVLPALVLAVVADHFGRRLAPDIYAHFRDNWPVLRVAVAAAMLESSWIWVQPLTAEPLWSVAYEFWYYLLFAGLYFLRGPSRIVTLVLLALVAGPRVLLLFPIWLMGSWIYRDRTLDRLPIAVCLALAVLPLAACWLYADLRVQTILGDLLQSLLGKSLFKNGLFLSRYVLSDTLLGVVVAAHFVGIRRFAPLLERALGAIEHPIRHLANYSFSLYAYHQSAIFLFAACLIAAGVTGPLLAAGVIVGTLLLVAGLGSLTEARRQSIKPLFTKTIGRAFRGRAWLTMPTYAVPPSA
jgi:peptidoglycan/LPS O-acetylase OafA/YrhL